jgi:hypothetical protein
VIDIRIQPDGGTLIMVDHRKAKPLRQDEQRIEQAIARALVVTSS